ncbi:MAG: hypothetical protein HY939_05755 [Gammaproteobacteria bacterium]|nr:hypothetical protein [Gammaproteobacteria bacterium]
MFHPNSLRQLAIPFLFFALPLFLSGCILTKQNETYTHDDVCAGIKRRMIYNTVSPNITTETIKESPAKLRQLYRENGCEDTE